MPKFFRNGLRWSQLCINEVYFGYCHHVYHDSHFYHYELGSNQHRPTNPRTFFELWKLLQAFSDFGDVSSTLDQGILVIWYSRNNWAFDSHLSTYLDTHSTYVDSTSSKHIAIDCLDYDRHIPSLAWNLLLGAASQIGRHQRSTESDTDICYLSYQCYSLHCLVVGKQQTTPVYQQ